MNRNLLRGFLQIGIFVGGGGVLLAFIQPKDSPEFIASICSAVVGFTLLIVVILFHRMTA